MDGTALKQLVSDVERDLLFHIILNMRKRNITVGEAEHLARDFLQLLPVTDKEELLKKLSALGERYPEAQAVFLKYASPHEEEKRQQLIEELSAHIKNGQIEKAILVGQSHYGR